MPRKERKTVPTRGPSTKQLLPASAAEPFVGREEELARLKRALQGAVAGTGRMEMLVGEPGIGKTRLTEELAAFAESTGVRVLNGRCYEAGGTPPYWPWIEALRPFIAESTPKELAGYLGEEAPLVAVMLSDLGRRIPGLKPYHSPMDDAESARFRLVDAVAVFLRRASGRVPLLIVLDDLHWADEGSLRLLVHLGRELKGSRIQVVGTYRDVELQRKHPLSKVLGELVRERLFEKHSLGGLTEGEVESYLARTGGGEIPRELAKTIHELSDGNPLFVSQLAR